MNKHLSALFLSAVLLGGALISFRPGYSREKDPAPAEKSGWVTVHLRGTPAEIGRQHGAILASRIADYLEVTKLGLVHDSGHDYAWFREQAQKFFWPKVDAEYREEMQGIVEGAKSKGVKIDIWDVVLMNAQLEVSPYFTKWYEHKNGVSSTAKVTNPGEHCSAFVATGSYTRDGKPVIAHNNWSGYLDGSRWNIMFDIQPAKGHRILMDGLPGVIHSGDDFGINDAGILITETTISAFNGFDPEGVPEFVRARKAMQYAESIDDFARIMKEGNNGGYANNWLVADRKTGEIADLELGLKNVTLRRTSDGYFVGTNFPVSDQLMAEETTFSRNDMSHSANARRVRAEEMVEKAKGTIDLNFAKAYLSDHWDSFDKKENPNERSLCGHIDLSPRGITGWQPAYGTAGTVQNKATTAAMAEKMTLQAAMGHSCGLHFKAQAHIAAHPEFNYEKALLRDLNSSPWATFSAK